MTDSWRGYIELSLLEYNHSVVNHLLHFVDPNNAEIYIQNIDRLWKAHKAKYVNTNYFETLTIFLKDLFLIKI